MGFIQATASEVRLSGSDGPAEPCCPDGTRRSGARARTRLLPPSGTSLCQSSSPVSGGVTPPPPPCADGHREHGMVAAFFLAPSRRHDPIQQPADTAGWPRCCARCCCSHPLQAKTARTLGQSIVSPRPRAGRRRTLPWPSHWAAWSRPPTHQPAPILDGVPQGEPRAAREGGV